MTAEVYRAFRIAYDGRGYHGFQRQPDQRTVEGAIRSALDELGASLDGDPGYAAASRTDAGVSAVAKTVAVSCPEWLDADALNGRLPDTIGAWAQTDVDATFHPRYDAVGREYTYIHYAPTVNLARVREACELLTGSHDFRHLSAEDPPGAHRLRACTVDRQDPYLVIRVRAAAFLRQQVRRIVSVLDDVGRGVRTFDELAAILDGAELPGERGIAPADPRALVLTDISYDDVTFEAHARAGPRLHDHFRRSALDVAREGRVFHTIADRIG